jgi:hypothetical protein
MALYFAVFPGLALHLRKIWFKIVFCFGPEALEQMGT